jgi:hypothetical protein
MGITYGLRNWPVREFCFITEVSEIEGTAEEFIL